MRVEAYFLISRGGSSRNILIKEVFVLSLKRLMNRDDFPAEPEQRDYLRSIYRFIRVVVTFTTSEDSVVSCSPHESIVNCVQYLAMK